MRKKPSMPVRTYLVVIAESEIVGTFYASFTSSSGEYPGV